MGLKEHNENTDVEQTEMLSNGATAFKDKSKLIDRGTWKNGTDFMLTCIGYAVGLGNIWRFPYLCYKNGGGAFLIPYFFCLITCGIPLLVLEIGLGQYMGIGSIGVWKICPGFAGIGVASFVIITMLNIYYIIILAWAIFYLYSSFTSVLPWSHCNNTWNTQRCYADSHMIQNSTQFVTNYTTFVPGRINQTADAVVEFWERRVLDISPGVDHPGSVVPGLAVSLLIAWVLVYFCIWRGVRWTGKIVYFTALFPYVVLTCLVIRGVTLDGATGGLWFYIKPDLARLADPQVWIDGGTQIFYSYAVAFGVLTSLGSYNKFNHDFFNHIAAAGAPNNGFLVFLVPVLPLHAFLASSCYPTDCMIIATVNSCTSLYCGVAVFSVLGFMAKQQSVSIAEVADSGPGLLFITYPKAITQMPFPQLWAIFFFLMILFIGLDSQFVDVEAFLTPIFDMFPKYLRGMKRRMLVTCLYCAVCFLVGISMITQGGMYVFQLFDYYSASGLVVLWVTFFETVIISWVFGSDRFQGAIELMIGYKIPLWFSICWKFITPLISMSIFLFIIVVFEPLTYNKTYTYPRAAQGLGLCLAIASIICIPIVFVIRFISAPGSFMEKWKKITKPRLREHQFVASRSTI